MEKLSSNRASSSLRFRQRKYWLFWGGNCNIRWRAYPLERSWLSHQNGSVSPYAPYLPSISSQLDQSNFSNTRATRNLLVLDTQPTVTSGTSSDYIIGTAGQDLNVTKALPLISVRLAPSVDTSAPGFLGEREIINRMQLILNSVGILSTHAVSIQLILNGQLSNNAWERVTAPSLSQLISHNASDTIEGGASVYNFEAQGGAGTEDRQPVLTNEGLAEVDYAW